MSSTLFAQGTTRKDSRVAGYVTLTALVALAGCAPTNASEPYRSGYPQKSGGDVGTLAMAPSDVESADEADVASSPRSNVDRSERPSEQQPQARPGLGTEWGETRTSVISSSPFSRADASSPFATAALFYNDENGAQSMASTSGFRRVSRGSVDVGGGVATIRLKDESGEFLSGFEAGGKKFLVGDAGDRYSIVIDSHVPSRLEIVVSVDGLDVLDGGEASFEKRGYLVDPHGSIEIDGFRQSMETVAAFRFGSVKSSYANKKHGESRNVGVIGVALFHENGSNPRSWSFGETKTRLQADPFPGRFATPPGQ